jgi:hypothetical protein
VVVAEGVRDDGGGHLQDPLADRCGPGGRRGDAEVVDEAGEIVGVQRPAGASAGEDQRESRLVAVFTLSRLSIHLRRSSANGAGTGEAGSPRRSRTGRCHGGRLSLVRRTTRLQGCA